MKTSIWIEEQTACFYLQTHNRSNWFDSITCSTMRINYSDEWEKNMNRAHTGNSPCRFQSIAHLIIQMSVYINYLLLIAVRIAYILVYSNFTLICVELENSFQSIYSIWNSLHFVFTLNVDKRIRHDFQFEFLTFVFGVHLWCQLEYLTHLKFRAHFRLVWLIHPFIQLLVFHLHFSETELCQMSGKLISLHSVV